MDLLRGFARMGFWGMLWYKYMEKVAEYWAYSTILKLGTPKG